MNCAICQRPLLEGAPACVVCGAPVQASRPMPPAPMPPVNAGAWDPRVSAVPGVGGAPPGDVAYGVRPSLPTAPPGSAAYGAPQPPVYAPPQAPMQAPQGYYPGYGGYSGNLAPPGGQPMALATSPPNNLAVASLVCGLLGLVPLWIGFILCILAITFGILGIQRAAQLPLARGKGMAIAGLVLGAVFLLPASCGL